MRSASAKLGAPAGRIMNSWKSIGLSAWAPPLTMFIIGTGSSDALRRRRHSGRAAGPPRLAAALATARLNAEDGVGAEPRLVGRAVELDHHPVDRRLIAAPRCRTAHRSVSPLTRLDRLQHALAAIALLVAVAQLHRLMGAGGGARRHGGAAEGAALQPHIDLDGRDCRGCPGSSRPRISTMRASWPVPCSISVEGLAGRSQRVAGMSFENSPCSARRTARGRDPDGSP